MNCPKCKSDDVIRVAAMYEQSTGSVSLSTSGVGIGAGGLGVGIAHSAGSTSTLAAQRMAPPIRAKNSPLAVFIGLGALLIAIGGLPGISKAGFLSGGGLMLLAAAAVLSFAIWFSRTDTGSRAATHTAEMAKWQRLWYCRRCAHAGDRDEFDAAAGS